MLREFKRSTDIVIDNKERYANVGYGSRPAAKFACRDTEKVGGLQGGIPRKLLYASTRPMSG